MRESKIRNDNYFVIYGWMIKRLHLKGVELQVFSIIYGFDRDGTGSFTGSLQYLMDFTNCCKNTVLKALNELVNKGYIKKVVNITNGVKHCSYQINKPLVQIWNQSSAETGRRVCAEIEPVDGAVSEHNKELINNIFTDNERIQAVIDRYHSICISFPKIADVTNKSRREILTRLDNYSLVDVERVFINAENSSFLKGSNGGWKATFDWLMKAGNFEKVLNGKYADKSPRVVPGWSETTLGEPELEAIQRVLSLDIPDDDLVCEGKLWETHKKLFAGFQRKMQ